MINFPEKNNVIASDPWATLLNRCQSKFLRVNQGERCLVKIKWGRKRDKMGKKLLLPAALVEREFLR